MEPVVNCEEIIGKTVGRQKAPNPLSLLPDQIQESNLWRQNGFRPQIPKGVYRFLSHEEADQWMMNHLTRKSKG
jgi:hypothetical protein